MNIKKLEDTSLSTNDILKIMNNNVNIITYPDLKNYKDINDLFSGSPNVILYFEEDKKGQNVIGHWEALKKVGNTIQFFDGYGIAPDYCRKWLSQNKLIDLKENSPELTRLIHKAIDEICEKNQGVAVVVKCSHTCACHRGVKHHGAVMITSKLSGDFMDEPECRKEFYDFVASAERSSK